VSRRAVASFEEPVKKISGDYGYIDLFWPGIVLMEHKSAGKDLGNAESQVFRYIQDLAREGRHQEIPRYVIVSDFARVALHDLEPEDQQGLPLFDNRRVATIQFPLAEFHQHVHAFAFIPGYKQHKFQEQDPINIEAVKIPGNLHDTLEAGGYTSAKSGGNLDASGGRTGGADFLKQRWQEANGGQLRRQSVRAVGLHRRGLAAVFWGGV
jgi:hypothetical protein